MLVCIDVGYEEHRARAAAVTFDRWTDASPRRDLTRWISPIADYVPGEFYRRELPCILELLDALDELPETVIVDGYVWLGNESLPGLGGHLYQALNGRAKVVGVSKNPFKRAAPVAEVYRGESGRPLYVSAVGMPLETAADRMGAMHGEHRLPTLLKRVDQLSKGLDPD